jgi:RNA polymerase sigma-70 factor (ECF subfamily)
LTELRSGSPEASGNLVELFYPELRRLASARMAGERSNHTWQPTVLVNELYLELTRVKSLRPDATVGVDERNAFFGLAAFLMRRLLVTPRAAVAEARDCSRAGVFGSAEWAG